MMKYSAIKTVAGQLYNCPTNDARMAADIEITPPTL